MLRRMMGFRLLAALALGLILAACQGDESPVAPPAEPTATPPVTAVQPIVVPGTDGQTYTIIEGRPLLTFPLQITRLISLEGGTLSLLGHTLIVPKHAVTSPTLFTLLVSLNGRVEVHLTALVPTLFRILDIGEVGFHKPVRLTLTYDYATNVADPNDLVIVHVPGLWGYDVVEPLPSTVDTTRKTVTAELEHFSRYALASN